MTPATLAPDANAKPDAATSTGLAVAYLVNQYPSVSHTFIRREILAVEASGVRVERFSVRRFGGGDLVDPVDRQEADRCRVLLETSWWSGLWIVLSMMFGRPLAFVRALTVMVAAWRRSDRGLVPHLAYLIEACFLADAVRRLGVDHVHAHFGTNPAMVAWLCHVLGGPPFSFTMHGSDEVDGVLKLSLPQKAAAAKFVVAVSEFGRSQLCRWCPVELWDNIHVVHCGLDPDFLDQRTAVPDTTKLVCVGRICREKAQPLLVRALEEVAARGIRFDVDLVGDGPMRELVEREIARAGLSDRIRVTGYVSSDDVRRAIEGARATVLPSFIEGIPVVLMESLARGRPVISTYVGGIPELVEPGVNGWLVPAGSVEALTEALVEVLTAPTEQLTDWGDAGADRVHRDHCARTEAAKLVALFAR